MSISAYGSAVPKRGLQFHVYFWIVAVVEITYVVLAGLGSDVIGVFSSLVTYWILGSLETTLAFVYAGGALWIAAHLEYIAATIAAKAVGIECDIAEILGAAVVSNTLPVLNDVEQGTRQPNAAPPPSSRSSASIAPYKPLILETQGTRAKFSQTRAVLVNAQRGLEAAAVAGGGGLVRGKSPAIPDVVHATLDNAHVSAAQADVVGVSAVDVHVKANKRFAASSTMKERASAFMLRQTQSVDENA